MLGTRPVYHFPVRDHGLDIMRPRRKTERDTRLTRWPMVNARWPAALTRVLEIEAA